MAARMARRVRWAAKRQLLHRLPPMVPIQWPVRPIKARDQRITIQQQRLTVEPGPQAARDQQVRVRPVQAQQNL
jgi:hypothetical protein